MNIILGFRGTQFLVDVVRLDAAMNHEVTARLVVKTLREYNVQEGDLRFFVTDSAAYNTKAYNEVLKPLLPNCTHARCLCHILRFVFH